MFGWHHRLNGHKFEQTLGDSEGQDSLECCSPSGHKESDMTQQLNNNISPVEHKFNKLHRTLFMNRVIHRHTFFFLFWLTLWAYQPIISLAWECENYYKGLIGSHTICVK